MQVFMTNTSRTPAKTAKIAGNGALLILYGTDGKAVASVEPCGRHIGVDEVPGKRIFIGRVG